MIDFSKGISAKRTHTNGGRFYGPEDLDVLHSTPQPLKPSWTNVASCESAPGLDEYFKNNGRWSNILGPTTAIIGTITHNAVDLLNNWAMEGKTGKKYQIDTDWILNELATNDDIRWKLVYPSIWGAVEVIKKQIWSYQEWFAEHQPTILHSEVMMWHPDVPYAGTADLVLNIYNKRQDQDILMMADLKTGAEMDKHFEQCMAYAILLEKIYNVKVSALGVLYCNGKWRGSVKQGKMKVKVVRNKNGEFTDDAKYLTNRVLTVYNLWKSKQKSDQPSKKIVLPKSFSLTVKSKG